MPNKTEIELTKRICEWQERIHDCFEINLNETIYNKKH